MNGRMSTKKFGGRGGFMFASKDGHPVVLDVPSVS